MRFVVFDSFSIIFFILKIIKNFKIFEVYEAQAPSNRVTYLNTIVLKN
jgi:hypothetical protein